MATTSSVCYLSTNLNIETSTPAPALPSAGSTWHGIKESSVEIRFMDELIQEIDQIFQQNISNFDPIRELITNLFTRVNLTTEEVNKFAFFDEGQRPYTRNLVSTDNIHYTLLILCWNSGRESSIHNHPCDGCFIKTLRGCIRETRYLLNEKTDEIYQSNIHFYNEGQVSYMHDTLGYHKIGNPSKNTGAVTLHLYTPPFKSCRVWSDIGPISTGKEAKPGYYSVYGHRAPPHTADGEIVHYFQDIPAHAQVLHSKWNKSLE